MKELDHHHSDSKKTIALGSSVKMGPSSPSSSLIALRLGCPWRLVGRGEFPMMLDLTHTSICSSANCIAHTSILVNCILILSFRISRRQLPSSRSKSTKPRYSDLFLACALLFFFFESRRHFRTFSGSTPLLPLNCSVQSPSDPTLLDGQFATSLMLFAFSCLSVSERFARKAGTSSKID